GCVAVAAEMTEHDAIDFSRKQFFDQGGSGVVGKMTVPRLNPLFHRPRATGVILQKFFVVISFDYQRVHLPQPFHDHLGRVTEVGDESETARAGKKCEAHWIDRVVWHRKGLDSDIADFEFGAGTKDSPVPMSI